MTDYRDDYITKGTRKDYVRLVDKQQYKRNVLDLTDSCCVLCKTDINSQIEERSRIWNGHISKTDDTRLVTNTKRSIGRPRKRQSDSMQESCYRTGQSPIKVLSSSDYYPIIGYIRNYIIQSNTESGFDSTVVLQTFMRVIQTFHVSWRPVVFSEQFPLITYQLVGVCSCVLK